MLTGLPDLQLFLVSEQGILVQLTWEEQGLPNKPSVTEITNLLRGFLDDSQNMNTNVEKHVKDIMENIIIEPSNNSQASSVMLVKKKDGSTLFCVDNIRLNAITEKDAFLIRALMTLDQLAGCTSFSILD